MKIIQGKQGYRNLGPTVKKDFDKLSKNDKEYLYWITRASWWCGIISVKQKSLSSYKLFKETYKYLNQDNKLPISSVNYHFKNYIAALLSNWGIFNTMGDDKIVPPNEEIFPLDYLDFLPNDEYETIFDKKDLGLKPFGKNGFYLGTPLSKEVIRELEHILKNKSISSLNTIVRYTYQNNSEEVINLIEVKIASLEKKIILPEEKVKILGDEYRLRVSTGAFSKEMGEIIKSLKEAKKCINKDEKPNKHKMLELLIEHFRTGDIKIHKESQICWVKDKDDSNRIEFNLGFIETYRDPTGYRAECEGFVALIDEEKSKKYKKISQNGQNLSLYLPWNKERQNLIYEKDKFNDPEFSSLNVVLFAGSRAPIGINIPNYDDIRQNHGFKNVYLENIVNASVSNIRNFPHVPEEMQGIYRRYQIPILEMHVALHELLGHGTGKLLSKEEVKSNWDQIVEDAKGYDIPIHNTYEELGYEENDTWSNKFSPIHPAYEECRAETVALALSRKKEIIDIFMPSISEEEKVNVVRCAVHMIIKSGLSSLFMYDEFEEKWTQAHSQGRFFIFSYLYQNLPEVFKLVGCTEELENLTPINPFHQQKAGKIIPFENGYLCQSFKLHINFKKSKELFKMIDKMLFILNFYKSLGDYKHGKEFFKKYSDPLANDVISKIYHFIMNTYNGKIPIDNYCIYPTPVKNKNTQEIELIWEYAETSDGCILSYVDKYNEYST